MQKPLLILLCSLLFAVANADATDTWQILINKQIICKGNSDQENTVATIKKRALTSGDNLVIKYSMDNGDKTCTRTFYISDSSDHNLATAKINQQTGSVTIKAEIIKRIMEKKQPFFIYTTSLPKDKGLAARIRVRRVLLCRIDWN